MKIHMGLEHKVCSETRAKRELRLELRRLKVRREQKLKKANAKSIENSTQKLPFRFRMCIAPPMEHEGSDSDGPTISCVSTVPSDDKISPSNEHESSKNTIKLPNGKENSEYLPVEIENAKNLPNEIENAENLPIEEKNAQNLCDRKENEQKLPQGNESAGINCTSTEENSENVEFNGDKRSEQWPDRKANAENIAPEGEEIDINIVKTVENIPVDSELVFASTIFTKPTGEDAKVTADIGKIAEGNHEDIGEISPDELLSLISSDGSVGKKSSSLDARLVEFSIY